MCGVLSWIGIVHMTDLMHVYFRSRVLRADIYLVGNKKSCKLTSIEITKMSCGMEKTTNAYRRNHVRRAFLDQDRSHDGLIECLF